MGHNSAQFYKSFHIVWAFSAIGGDIENKKRVLLVL